MMSVPRPEPIRLLPEEAALLEGIDFSLSSQDYRKNRETLGIAADLTKRLIDRGAVPDIRAQFLTDPELNIGCRMGSRMQVFERNGTRGDAIFKHPHFLKYLRYLLHGPQLPPETIDGLRRIVEEDRGTSGMVMDQLRKFTRSEVRRLGLDRAYAREEFFKLALECALNRNLALVIRDAAGTAK